MDAFWDNIGLKYFKKTEVMGNGKGCVEWVGAKKGKSGYGIQVVKWPGGEEKRETAHRLAYMIKHRLTRYDMPQIDENNNKVECSHICHQTLCVNPEHILIEPHAINQDRLHCKNQGIALKVTAILFNIALYADPPTGLHNEEQYKVLKLILLDQN
ncbi:Hypothetical predicted protein [Mytilus galloprovincialis]|uniref:Zinc-binding loop region of homing endonuclease domain-containing protein n=1 Tax=Mytilus galloprovincialis TaxID=29158 RepID=A0A8B6E5J0_MYTGA|nr:Hypothetical predicted protein [Mytilus galloprovincialis]